MTTPTLDAHNKSTSSGGTTTTISVTTGGANKIVFVACAVGGVTASIPVLTIAGASLTWTALDSTRSASGTNVSPKGFAVQLWWALAPTQLTAQTVTITSSLTIDDAATVYASFTGTFSSSPVDTAAGAISAVNHKTAGTQDSVTLSSVGSNDLAIIMAGSMSFPSSSPLPVLANTTIIDNVTNSGGSLFAFVDLAYAIFSSPQTNVVVGFSSGNAANGIGLIGAMIAADGSGGVVATRKRRHVMVAT